jgi:hypothetical protein
VTTLPSNQTAIFSPTSLHTSPTQPEALLPPPSPYVPNAIGGRPPTTPRLVHQAPPSQARCHTRPARCPNALTRMADRPTTHSARPPGANTHRRPATQHQPQPAFQGIPSSRRKRDQLTHLLSLPSKRSHTGSRPLTNTPARSSAASPAPTGGATAAIPASVTRLQRPSEVAHRRSTLTSNPNSSTMRISDSRRRPDRCHHSDL